ncbi:MAG: nitroreductase family protein [Nitrospinae bacterium]|nr:nitroreductase family protein [Nitrospinota bacterium]
MENNRKAEAGVDRLFLDRWSPRAFDPAPLPNEVVRTLFEAAKWAPSCSNEQPWLFIYAITKKDHARFLDLLLPGNQIWAKNAPIIIFLFAHRRFETEGKPNDWSKFDSGAAWMSLAIQARLLGLYTHGMAGFHRDRVCAALGVPEEDYEPVCAIVAGRYGDKEALPERLKARETPSDRKPLADVAMEGRFK